MWELEEKGNKRITSKSHLSTDLRTYELSHTRTTGLKQRRKIKEKFDIVETKRWKDKLRTLKCNYIISDLEKCTRWLTLQD